MSNDPTQYLHYQILQELEALEDAKFFTVQDIASFMQVSKMTVYRLVRTGELQALRVGRSYRVPHDALKSYIVSSINALRPPQSEQQPMDVVDVVDEPLELSPKVARLH